MAETPDVKPLVNLFWLILAAVLIWKISNALIDVLIAALR